MVTVFIDESGNLGRGGKYFVVAAIVFEDAEKSKRIKRLVKRTALRIGLRDHGAVLSELKSHHLSFPDKQKFLNDMASRPDHEIFYLAAEKKHVRLLKQGRPKNLVYNYFANLLAREIAKKYPNEKINFLFDSRSTKVKSLNSLGDYIEIEAYNMLNFTGEIAVGQADSKSSRGLQAADIISNTIYSALDRNKHHLIDIISSRIEHRQHFPRGKFGSK